MTTKAESPQEQMLTSRTEDLPPLRVTTEGIPAQEHVESVEPSGATVGERRRRWFAWALAGVLGLVLIVAGVAGVLSRQQPVEPSLAHMGLTTQAWQEYRAGERASSAMGHMGLTLPAWQQFRAGERASTITDHMGLTTQAWQEFRAGERASTTTQHMGLSPQAWQEFRAGERS